MEDQPETTEKPIDAQVNLRDTGQGLEIEVRNGKGAGPLNPAVHFANWIGENMQALSALARSGYVHKVEAQKAARRVLTPVPRIMGPDGSPLQ